MNKTPIWFIFTTIVIALSTPGIAAPVGDVMQACDNMNARDETCTIGIKDGKLVGCTGNVVFECDPGTRECKGSKNNSGKCNQDGTAARMLPLQGKALLLELTAK